MKTELFGKSNAVLVTDEGEFVAVIGCKPKEVIDHKLEQAIKDHYVAEDVRINCLETLNNQKTITFGAEIFDEDGDKDFRQFRISIVASY